MCWCYRKFVVTIWAGSGQTRREDQNGSSIRTAVSTSLFTPSCATHFNSSPNRIDTMDTQSLRTASTYINNLLLSRGLLRNGTSIEFAAPAKAEGGVDATMAKVMNLVHDLVLRRDVC